ncbi:MAG: MFS transporter [Elusimicrobiota bacterium]|nr:MFS transporter [Elusimicrobiota bacterium]
MKRALSSLVVSALLLTIPGPQAWAVVAASARAIPSGASAIGGQAGAARLALPGGSVTALPLSPLTLTSPNLAPAPRLLNAPSAPVSPAAAARVGVAADAPAVKTVAPAAAPDAAPLAALEAAGVQAAEFAAPQASEGAAKAGSDRAFDLSAVKTGAASDGVVAPVAGPSVNGLTAPADGPNIPGSRPPSPPSAASSNFRRSMPGRGLMALVRFGAGLGAVLGLQALAVALAPAVFGVVPVAAVWAVSSGLLIAPVALYARYRLARRDSPRLDKVKWITDVALGVFAGAAFIAWPSLALTLSGGAIATAALPLLAVAGGRWVGGTAFADSLLVWGALGITPLLMSAVGVPGLIGVAPLLGMMALPALTTVSFFLGRLIHAAETGQPFGVPGSMQKIRFPSFQWVMIGVVFALLTGYSAVHTNIAFLIWTLTGARAGNSLKTVFKEARFSIGGIIATVLRIFTFDRLFLGLLAYTAFTGFSSPLTFLVIAFAGERMALWTERLLVKVLPRGAAAPSTKAKPVEDPARLDEKGPAWPRFHYWTKMFLLLGTMGATGLLMGAAVFGFSSLFTNLAIAGAMAFIPFFFANWIIKKLMRTEPATEQQDPEFFAIMRELRERINAERAAKGKKPIPMPEMVIDPMEAPNAYATGRSPFKATVGMTRGIKAMTLEPENVRDGVKRLISATAPDTKAFRVFRMAIAGSIPGVSLQSSPAEIVGALEKADHVALKALGTRMLRGVMGHEFSHVMDRHMLSGSVAGAISSGVAFASYGVMWAVGHAQVMVGRLKDRLLGRKPAPAAEETRRSGGEAGGVRPEALDPISTGVVLKSLPALAKLFAALWVPILLQVMQMASSRNNEGMADEDGALLSEDPESLALGLGLLTTWRPPVGFVIPGARIPTLMAISHMTTVNPFEQLHNADAMPKLDALAEAVVGKGDDFLFELFITHPNTGLRISNLHDMAEALRAARGRRAPPAPPAAPAAAPEEGPPLSFVPRAPNIAPAVRGGGLFQGAWKAAAGLFRVLPDEGRNKEFWKYTIGQALVSLGVAFHYTALPKLAAPAKEDAANIGYNRAANWGAQAVAGIATGPLVDRTSTQKVIVWTYLGRALLMFLVPALFFSTGLSFWVFTGVIALAGFLQMTGMTAQAVAFNRILAKDEAHYNRANAVAAFVFNAAGVVGPILAGSFIGAVSAHFGLLSGNAAAYAVYGVLLLAVAVGYALWLNLPRDETMSARRGLDARLRAEGVGGQARYRGVATAHEDGGTVLLVEVDGDPARAVVPASFEGFAVRASPRRRVTRELVEGLRLVFRDRYLKYYLLFMTLSQLAGDALIFAAIPRYLSDVLLIDGAAFGYYLAALALGSGLGSALMALARDRDEAAFAAAGRGLKERLARDEPALEAGTLVAGERAVSGAYAVLLARYKAAWEADPSAAPTVESLADDAVADAAARLGAALGRTPQEARALLTLSGAERALRAWAERRGEAVLARERRDAATGFDRLQRQGVWTSWLYGVSWFAYAGAFFAGGLWLSVGLVLTAALLATPAMVVWSGLTTRVVSTSYPESQGKVYSAMYVYQLAWSIIGILLFGGLLASLPTATVLVVAAVILAVCGLIDFIEPAVIFPLRKGRR